MWHGLRRQAPCSEEADEMCDAMNRHEEAEYDSHRSQSSPSLEKPVRMPEERLLKRPADQPSRLGSIIGA